MVYIFIYYYKYKSSWTSQTIPIYDIETSIFIYLFYQYTVRLIFRYKNTFAQHQNNDNCSDKNDKDKKELIKIVV